MKKRVKLLTTIASLCLAVALMAFGVYAASTATFNLTSSVSFGTTNVAAHLDWEITGGEVVPAGEGQETPSRTGKITRNLQEPDVETSQAITAMKFAETAKNNDTIVYKFTITNDSTNAIDVTVTQDQTAETKANYSVTSAVLDEINSEGTGTTKNLKVAKDDVVVYTITVTLLDNSADFASPVQIAVTFQAAKAA